MSLSLNEIPIYDELIKRCDVKVQSDNLGHIIYRTNSSWKTFSSKKFASLPNDYQYYRDNNRPNELDDMLVSIELDQLNTENKDKVDFHSLCQSIQIQLQKSFYNDVKTTVYICQLDKSGKKIREDYLKSNYKTKGFDIKLNITINYKGEVEIRHVASDNYMQAYVNKWEKEAKARGLDIDVEELRKRCIQDFESKATEQSFYTRFIQNIKSHFNENIIGYIEGIQATQKIAKNVWAEGTVNQSTWLTKDDEHKKWPKYVQFHPLVGGVTDGAIDEIAGIPLAVKGVYEIATDEEKQQALLKVFTKEGAKQMLEGLANDAKETLKDKDKSQHFAGQTAVSVASMISGAGFFSKAGKIDDVADLGADLSKTIPDANTTKFLDNVKKVERHVETDKAVKQLTEEVGGERLSEAVDELNDLTENAVKKGKKFTWQEIKGFFKRGNDFNEKVKFLDPPKYDFHEVTVEHIIDGKPKKFRLDSYNEGLEIVSRKATDFDNIKLSTFEGYLKELKKKYPEGSKITAPKYPELNGKTLKGKLKLEVPETNKLSAKLKEFQELAKKYEIEIIFESE